MLRQAEGNTLLARETGRMSRRTEFTVRSSMFPERRTRNFESRRSRISRTSRGTAWTLAGCFSIQLNRQLSCRKGDQTG